MPNDQVFRFDLLEDIRQRPLLLAAYCRTKTDTRRFGTVFDDLLQTGKSATANEQDVGRVDLQEILVGMLTAALGGTLAMVPSISLAMPAERLHQTRHG